MTAYPIDSRSSNGTLLRQGDQYIKGSLESDPDLDDAGNKNYGQNGFTGASSDLPGQKTTSGFLPACDLPKTNAQTRTVSDKPYPSAHGMKAPGFVAIDKANLHPVTKAAPAGALKR